MNQFSKSVSPKNKVLSEEDLYRRRLRKEFELRNK